MLQFHFCFDENFKPENPETESIWGIIYVKTGNTCFPSDDWDDFLSDVLSMWLWDIAGIISGECKMPYDLYFMDGAYQIRLFPTDRENVISAKFLRDNTILEMVDEDIHFQEFVRQLLDAAQRLLADERTKCYTAASGQIKLAMEHLLNTIAEHL